MQRSNIRFNLFVKHNKQIQFVIANQDITVQYINSLNSNPKSNISCK